MWMTTVGIVSQLIPRIVSIDNGVYTPKALFMLSAAAIIGIAGSYFWGLLIWRLVRKKPAYSMEYGISWQLDFCCFSPMAQHLCGSVL